MSNHILDMLAPWYDVVSFYNQQNSSHGVCLKQNSKFFFKASTTKDIDNEVRGCNHAIKLICTPQIENIININSLTKVIIYKYEDTIKYNEGLLCDILNDDTSFQDYVEILNLILDPYWSLANNTGNLTESVSYKKFVQERIMSRYIDWYFNSDILHNLLIKFHLKDYSIFDILNYVRKFVSDFKPVKGILSHGDPGDLNIGIKPIFFDLETFGFNPLALEFSTFFWNIFLGGDYFFPTYHSSKYVFHNNVYKNTHKFDIHYSWNNNVIEIQNLRFYMSKKRIYTLHTIINAFSRINNLSDIKSTNDEIICLLIFRILTIINYHTMSLNDKVLLLAITVMVYEGIKHDAFSYLKNMLDIFNKEAEG